MCVFADCGLAFVGEGTFPILMTDLCHHGDLTLCIRGVMAHPDLDSGEFTFFFGYFAFVKILTLNIFESFSLRDTSLF